MSCRNVRDYNRTTSCRKVSGVVELRHVERSVVQI